MAYKSALKSCFDEVKRMDNAGKVATYIPELAHVDPNQFGVYLLPLKEPASAFGDSEKRFTIQSISKVFTLALAYSLKGEALWQRVGVEPSGNPFNSLLQLEHDRGIPRNPMINAGALVVCDELVSQLDDPRKTIMEWMGSALGDTVRINKKVAASEKATGFRNTALINLMKAFGNIHNAIDQVLDLYFDLCSLEMNCRELATSFAFLANDGRIPSGKQLISESHSKRINAIMQTCGFYDEAGEFSFRVGLPGKSGVSGAIAAVYPDHYVMAVWSPSLNDKGNSVQGLQLLELFTTQTGKSIF